MGGAVTVLIKGIGTGFYEFDRPVAGWLIHSKKRYFRFTQKTVVIALYRIGLAKSAVQVGMDILIPRHRN